MKIQFLRILSFLALVGTALPVLAGHGPLDSTTRDAWINDKIALLVDQGLVQKPDQPLADLTNRQIAQLAGDAAKMVLAQADLPLPPMDEPGLPMPPSQTSVYSTAPLSPQAAKSLTDLVEEFRNELSPMGLDLDKLEDSIYARDHRNETLAELQKQYLKRTGVEAGGYSRGYFHSIDVPGSQPTFTDVMFIEMAFKAIPVPYNLFDLRLRVWRTIGLYYADPISTKFEFRWISLNNVNELCNITAGDFYKSYTPLTLWNNQVPVYTLIEPTSFQRRRKEAEEILFLDHGNDWRMRGFQASTTVDGKDDKFFSKLDGHVMFGSQKGPAELRFGDYFAATRWSLSLAENHLGLGGTGLLIWNDPGSANVPYIPNFPDTFAKEYRIMSGEGNFNIPFAPEVSLSGNGEYAFAQYQDDARNPDRQFEDWALRANASLDISKIQFKAKFLNVGPYYYSPGAQTNRFSAGSQNGYQSTNLNKDDFLIGYLNKFSFQGVDRPSFAIYDRLAENILPYGDATPNRLGWAFGFSAEIGKDGWLQPQASWIPSIKEIQANYVLNPPGNGAVAVDTGMAAPNAITRTFSGYEGALTLDLAKAFDWSGKTLRLSGDYKSQKSDLGLGDPLIVNTAIAAVDFNIPVKGVLEGITWSGALVQVQSSGSEYVLSTSGPPATSAQYPFYLDTAALGTYSYSSLDIQRRTWVAGLQYSLSKTILVRGDLFLNRYTTPSKFNDDIWRISYEASF